LGGLNALGVRVAVCVFRPEVALWCEAATCPSGMGFWVDFVSHQLGVTPSLGDLQRSSPAMPGVLMTTATPKPANTPRKTPKIE